jgi:hypothetical protein
MMNQHSSSSSLGAQKQNKMTTRVDSLSSSLDCAQKKRTMNWCLSSFSSGAQEQNKKKTTTNVGLLSSFLDA